MGYWTEQKKEGGKSINIVRSYTKEKDQVLDRLNKHLIVTTRLVSKNHKQFNVKIHEMFFFLFFNIKGGSLCYEKTAC